MQNISSLYGTDNLSSGKLTTSRIAEVASSGFSDVIFSLFSIGDSCSTESQEQLFYNGVKLKLGEGTNFTLLNWAKSIQALKESGIRKIFFSFGSCEQEESGKLDRVITYKDCRSITDPCIPQNSTFYQNFVSLKKYFPMVDGIDIDQSWFTDSNDIIAIGKMLFDIGFQELSFSPKHSGDIQSISKMAKEINQHASDAGDASIQGFVTRINLQSQADTSCNNISAWQTATQNMAEASKCDAPKILIGRSFASPTSLHRFFKAVNTDQIDGVTAWSAPLNDTHLNKLHQALTTGLNKSKSTD